MKKQLSEATEHQINLLSKYYPVDIEKREITLRLHYKKVSDINDSSLAHDKFHPSRSVLQKVSDIIDSFPNEFKTKLEIKIDDYEEYDPKEVESTFEDSIQLFHTSYSRDKAKTWISAAIMFAIGVLVIFFRFALNSYEWMADKMMGSLLREANTVIGTVFIWQAVMVVFMNGTSYANINHRMIEKIEEIVFLDKSEKVLISKRKDDLRANWSIEHKGISIARLVLLISGSFILITGGISLLSLICTMVQQPSVPLLILTILAIPFCSIYVISGIGAFNICRGVDKFQKVVPFFVVILLLIHGLALAIGIYSLVSKNDSSTFGTTVVTFVGCVLFFVAWVVYTGVLKRENKGNKE